MAKTGMAQMVQLGNGGNMDQPVLMAVRKGNDLAKGCGQGSGTNVNEIAVSGHKCQ